MRVSVAILQCLTDTASSLSQICPSFFKYLEFIYRKVSPTSTGTNLLLPHRAQASVQSPTYPGSSSPTLLQPLPANPGLLTIFIAKKWKAQRLPASSVFPLKRMWSIQLSSPWSARTRLLSPISCYLCRGVFHYVSLSCWHPGVFQGGGSVPARTWQECAPFRREKAREGASRKARESNLAESCAPAPLELDGQGVRWGAAGDCIFVPAGRDGEL